MVALQDNYFLTPEDYLKLEQDSVTKHEYIDGEIYAMAGTTDTHNTIALNLATVIRLHLRGTECRVYFADIKARLEEKNRFYYPDLLVTCDERDRETPTYKRFSKLIIEVLSEGTERFDRGDKFRDYQTLSSLEEYVLVDSSQQRVETFCRQESNTWRYKAYDYSDPEITFSSIDLKIAIADIYEDVMFEKGIDSVTKNDRSLK